MPGGEDTRSLKTPLYLLLWKVLRNFLGMDNERKEAATDGPLALRWPHRHSTTQAVG